jgi:hypothetical protein
MENFSDQAGEGALILIGRALQFLAQLRLKPHCDLFELIRHVIASVGCGEHR